MIRFYSKSATIKPLLQKRSKALALPCWPHDTLVFFRDRSQAFVNELLHAPTFVGLGGVEVAFRIGGNVMYPVELTRLTSTIPEARQDFERIAQQDVHLRVLSIR